MRISLVNLIDPSLRAARELLLSQDAVNSMVVTNVPKSLQSELIQFLLREKGLHAIIPQGNCIIESGQAILVLPGTSIQLDGHQLILRQQIHSGNDPIPQEISYEEQLQLLAENYPNGSISLLDLDLNIIYTAGLGYLEYNINPKDLIGRPAKEVLLPTLFEKLKSALDDLIKGEVVIFEASFQEQFFQNTCKVIMRNGQPEYVMMVVVDVTHRKMAEDKLMEREANLKAIFESTNNIIGLFDQDQHLVEFNQAFQDYAMATDQLKLYPGIDVLTKLGGPYEKIFRQFQMRALNGEKFRELIDYPVGDQTLYFMFNYNPIVQDGVVTGVSWFAEDITELRQSQKELESYTQNLEKEVANRTQELKEKNVELEKGYHELEVALKNLQSTQSQLVQAEKMASLGILSAGIGHEINNPLNFIKNGCSALINELKKNENYDSRDLKPYFDIINDGVTRAASIVKSLSHFSREVKKMDECCQVHDILDNCLVILQSRLKHRIKIKKKYSSESPVVLANEGKLHQAFLNLLSNAEHAIEEAGEITIRTKTKNGSVHIVIKDTGIGIPKEHLPRLGDPFFTTKEPGVGTGLGLFITYNIINELSGSVRVKSMENSGTEFKITLPKA